MKTTAPCLIIALLLIAANAPKPRQRPFISPRALKAAELSPAQRAQVNQLQADFDKEQAAWMTDHQAQRAALREQITAARAAGDQTKAAELSAQWRQQFQPLTQLREKYRERLRTLLTDQQNRRLDEALAKRHHGERTVRKSTGR